MQSNHSSGSSSISITKAEFDPAKIGKLDESPVIKRSSMELKSSKSTDYDKMSNYNDNKPMLLNLLNLILKNRLAVTGTRSYQEGQVLPTEACKPIEDASSKFGGLFENQSFKLKYQLLDPILMKGYGIQTADMELDPV